MAFIDDFNKLVVMKGQQQKVADKDKAIIEIAKEIVESPKIEKIISVWEKISGVYTRLQSVTPEGQKPQVFNLTTSPSLGYLCNDENEPQDDESNVVAVVDVQAYQISTDIKRQIRFSYHNYQFSQDNDILKGYLSFWDETETQQGSPDIFINVN